MIEVTKFFVRTFDIDHLDIFWELSDVVGSLGRYEFYLLRSVDGPGGPYRPIAGPFQNQYIFRDPDVHQLHKWRTYYYRLRVVDKDTGEENEYGPAWLGEEPDLITMEIRRRFELVLREHNGRAAFYFPALTFGERCPSCWDGNSSGNYIGRSKQQNCHTCYDMTFVGGYARPILIWIQIDPTTTSPQRLDITERAPEDTRARLSAFPPITPKSMIVEADNTRWHVERTTPTQKLRATAHQEVVLHQMVRDDVRQKVPVNFDPLAEFASAREFTRPMCLDIDDAGRPVPDILGGE